MELLLYLKAIETNSEGIVLHLASSEELMGHEKVFIEGGPHVLELEVSGTETQVPVPKLTINVRGMVESEEYGLKLLLPR